MLLELKIKNLAIIESVDVKFGEGLNVITGETGAGKSILLAALNLVIGGRSDKELIRTGKEEATVEAVFSHSQVVSEMIGEWGIDADPSEPLVLRRSIHVSGRSRAFVNCSSAPANQIRKIAPLLLDFGRQHEQSVLMSADKHIELLDRYANQEELSAKVSAKYREVLSLEQEYKSLKSTKGQRAEKRDFLLFQKRNIEEINPQPNEEDELTEELNRLSDIDQCRDLAKDGEKELCKKPDCIQDQLAQVVSRLGDLSTLDSSIQHVVDDLDNALIAVQEAASSLHDYQRNLAADPEKIEEVQDRLEQIIELQNKHGGSYESIMEKLKEIDLELKKIDKENQRLQKLGEIITKAKQGLCRDAIRLSGERQKSAGKLIPLIQKELNDLAMKNASFSIGFEKVEPFIECALDEASYSIGATGLESVYFLFSANKGEDLKPLEKVASGGEMSRIMLAIKRIIGGAFAVPTVIFDEIDSGISGQASTSVAQKLRQIADDKEPPLQIICISHTAQVAAEANFHFLVKKKTVGDRTLSQIKKMSYEQRLNEISRMLSGDQSKEQALALAEKLVKK